MDQALPSIVAVLAGPWDEYVTFRADGEPLLKSIGVELYRISALLDGGATVDVVMTDYPSLSREEIEAAGAYAGAHPNMGKPYPPISVKRVLARGGFEALDEVWPRRR